MSDRPLVSIIIPTYNCDRFLEEALTSVVQQDYAVREIIVVDDGSTDSTVAFAKRFPEVRLLTQRNAGPAAARNVGVRASFGKYLAFLDGDDIWFPGKLSSQIAYAESHPDHPIVFGQFAFWRRDAGGLYPPAEEFPKRPGSWEITEPLSGWIYADVLLDSVICIITALIHRSVYDDVGGFDESLRGGSDYDFWLRSTHRFRAHKLPQCLALYRLHGKGVTSIPKRVNYPYLVLSRALETLGSSGPDGRNVDRAAMDARLAKLCFQYGRLQFRRGDLRLARSAFLQSLKHSAPNPRAVAYLLLSMLRAPLGR
jgi:glycosyltransferase involved in cell wall biosynthesis